MHMHKDYIKIYACMLTCVVTCMLTHIDTIIIYGIVCISMMLTCVRTYNMQAQIRESANEYKKEGR